MLGTPSTLQVFWSMGHEIDSEKVVHKTFGLLVDLFHCKFIFFICTLTFQSTSSDIGCGKFE